MGTMIGLACGGASGGEPTESDGEQGRALAGTIAETSKLIGDHLGPIDWEEGHPHIKRALERIWERNGWQSDVDLAMRDLACEISAIPPWQIMKRLDLMCQRVGERYSFSAEQAALFKDAVMRETSTWVARHAGTFFEQIRGGLPVDTLPGGIDPEQVARWTKESEALVADVRHAFDRVLLELEPSFTPEQRAILDHDLPTVNKRWDDVLRMRSRWAAGEWQAEDWGMPEDSNLNHTPPSIRSATVRKRATRGGDTPPEPTPESQTLVVPKWVTHDPSTWFAYVLEVTRRFDLKPGQMTAAWSVHAEIVSRANTYILTHADGLKPVAVSERSTHDAYDPIRLLFEELRNRLEAIPTTAQRAQAAP